MLLKNLKKLKKHTQYYQINKNVLSMISMVTQPLIITEIQADLAEALEEASTLVVSIFLAYLMIYLVVTLEALALEVSEAINEIRQDVVKIFYIK